MMMIHGKYFGNEKGGVNYLSVVLQVIEYKMEKGCDYK